MEDEVDPYGTHVGRPANDNRGPAGNDEDIAPWQRLDKVVLSVARLLGRQMAREQFEALTSANDNEPADGASSAGRGAELRSRRGKAD